jgi:plasmid stabilization system protein ParE
VIPYAFHPEAEAELAEAARFFESRVHGLGKAFIDAVELVISLIRQYPEVGTLVGQSRRRVLVRGFPYAVVYQSQPDFVLILAIAHLRRRPGYWRARE